MAPLPMDYGVLSTAAHTVVGGSKSALSWPTVLAFLSILIAAMQGTLVMESADPCRISYRKVCILLGLEVAEVIVIGASEVLSFVQLRTALRIRLEWLQFVPPCILMIGFSEMLIDVMYTLMCAAQSRTEWIPFSASGRKADGSSRPHWETLFLIVTAGCSFVLVGWRQRWWWVSEAVSENVARRAIEENRALSVGVMGFCVGWGLIISVCVTLFMSWGFAVEFFKDIPYLFRPIYFMETLLKDESRTSSSMFEEMEREPTPELRSQQKFLNRYRYGELVDESANMDVDELDCQLAFAPLHVGNAIVGEDQRAVHEKDEEGSAFAHVLFLVVEHLSIFPLLLSVVIAVAQLWDKMDVQTFNSVKELVDVVIVVAFVEIAIGLKSLLWGVKGLGDGKADKVFSDDSRWIQKVLNERRENNKQDYSSGKSEGGEDAEHDD